MNTRTKLLLTPFTCLLIALALPAVAEDNREIRELLSRWEKAFSAKDIDGVMSCYATGERLVAFDIVPPLVRNGRDAYRKNYEGFFAMYDGPLQMEIRDLQITASGDVAFITCLERMSGILKGGQKSDVWCRVTSGLSKIEGKWLIIHDHVSVPVDFDSGKALLELKP